jgi:methylated-DNA-[protein]-cysteine S-methyltransferase
MKRQQSAVLPTPYGEITVRWAGDVLMDISLGPYGVYSEAEEAEEGPDFPLLSQLVDYFKGRPVTFSVQLNRTGYTDFQWQVWRTLQDIPYGETRAYGWVARRIGRPTAPRAVGGAVGRNPFAIVVPCHRVIGANGDLVGFGGGLDWKRALLGLEGALSAPSRQLGRCP